MSGQNGGVRNPQQTHPLAPERRENRERGEKKPRGHVFSLVKSSSTSLAAALYEIRSGEGEPWRRLFFLILCASGRALSAIAYYRWEVIARRHARPVVVDFVFLHQKRQSLDDLID